MGNSYSTASQAQTQKPVEAAAVGKTPATTSKEVVPVAKVTEPIPNLEAEVEKKTALKKDKSAFKYDGRLDHVISPNLMCYLQSVHDEKGEPVSIWGYHLQTKGDVYHGKTITILEENNMYTSDYDEIFENIYNSMPIWKGNDRLLIYEDSEVEVRVAFANRRHAKHFLHCFKCHRNGDPWPRNDKEWEEW